MARVSSGTGRAPATSPPRRPRPAAWRRSTSPSATRTCRCRTPAASRPRRSAGGSPSGPGGPAGDRGGLAVPADPADRRARAGRHRHPGRRRRAAARPRARHPRPAHRPRRRGPAARRGGPAPAARQVLLPAAGRRVLGRRAAAAARPAGDLRGDHPGGRVLLFGHEAIVLLLRYLVEGLSEAGADGRGPRRPRIANCSISSWRRAGDGCEPERSTSSSTCTARAPTRPDRRTSMPNRSERARSSPRTCCATGRCRTRRAARSPAAPSWWSAVPGPRPARCCSPGWPRCGPAPAGCSWR